jgi:hypothetical protein
MTLQCTICGCTDYEGAVFIDSNICLDCALDEDSDIDMDDIPGFKG